MARDKTQNIENSTLELVWSERGEERGIVGVCRCQQLDVHILKGLKKKLMLVGGKGFLRRAVSKSYQRLPKNIEKKIGEEYLICLF